jgi:predicted ATPase/class 3 adenylate cyclase
MNADFTFLFTDIEGSTRLWEQQQQVMSLLLTDHNCILEHAIASHNGKVFKTVGDGFCAVFDVALDALAAALDAQRALGSVRNRKNPHSVTLKVRMGLHCGPAEERDGDYFGPTLNRTARLMAAASGGQILLSSTIKEHLWQTLPQGIQLRDLGKHRLRDLKETQNIFQIVAPDLSSNFPPIRSLSPRATNLPTQLTSFVGRNNEVDEICRLMRLSHVRLLTLLGSGGIGKTRLSIQAGSNLQDEYEDGVFFVALAPVAYLEGIVEAIAEILKVDDSGDTTLLEALKAHLRNRHLLLILDNFEQVIDTALLISELLEAAPYIKILITSREELMIYGENVYTVPPLTLPETIPMMDPQALMQIPAITLFVERVQSIHHDFSASVVNISHIVEICQRLDGLPLAIELAAVRIRDFSVEEIAKQLSSRLQILSKGPRDFPSRQRTMRGAIEWSYDMLTELEQEAFARLGIFVGAFTPEAAAAIAGVEGLSRLKQKSLIHQFDDGKVTSFLMLETLREYALEQLHVLCDSETLQRRHADYYLQLIKTAEPHLTGANQVEWFSRLEVEKHNVQASLEWLLSRDDIEKAACMAAVLWRFWGAQSRLSLGTYWMEQVLSHHEAMSTALHAEVTHGIGRLLFHRCRYLEATEYLKSSLALYEKSNNQNGQAATHLSLGEIQLLQANHLSAEKHLQTSLTLYLELEDQAGLARCVGQLGRLAVREDNLAGAESLFKFSLDLTRRHGSTESTAMVMNDLAEVLRAQQKYDEAAVFYHQCLALYRELDFRIGVAVILHNVGQVARQLHDYREALQFFQEALSLMHDFEEKQIIAECLAGIGGVFLSIEEKEYAVHCLSAADALIDTLHLQLNLADRVQYESTLSEGRQQLDEATWKGLWLEGQSMPLEQIVTNTLRMCKDKLSSDAANLTDDFFTRLPNKVSG